MGLCGNLKDGPAVLTNRGDDDEGLAGVSSTIAVAVLLPWVGRHRTVITDVPHTVAIRIFLTWVAHFRAIVPVGTKAVTITVVQRIERTGIARISVTIEIAVFLERVGDLRTVVLRTSIPREPIVAEPVVIEFGAVIAHVAHT